MQKGFSPVLVLIGITVILVIAAGAYYLNDLFAPMLKLQSSLVNSSGSKPTNTPQLTSVPASSPEETVYTEASRSANWKTYTNNAFYFKYPERFIVVENSPGIISVRRKSIYTDEYYQIFQISNKETINLNSYKECRDIQSTSELDEIEFPCYIQTENSPKFDYPKRITKLGGNITIDIRTRYSGTGRSERLIKTIEGPKVEVNIGYGEGFDEEIEKLIYQILSTFKFTN